MSSAGAGEAGGMLAGVEVQATRMSMTTPATIALKMTCLLESISDYLL